ncbi:hypothetical protein RvY_08071 [Ramazzottius varieornatus]|uniref:Uncharacterized protein n=1 Tax=Ramazzottius varieornatus TaxID=947166 RepID=A0A1D1VCQ3_RAMVA|nr:hypothetical protein RvY_08071 [Ramazzottius varieornatus]
MFFTVKMSSICGLLLLTATGALGAPASTMPNQSVVLQPGRPVVVEIPPNSSVNVTVQQNPPSIIQNNGPVPNPDKVAITPSSTSSLSTTMVSTTMPTVTPSSASMAGGDFDMYGGAVDSLVNRTTMMAPSIMGTPSPINNERNYIPAVMLPLGSEGPNANRETPLNAVLPFGATLDSAVSPPSIMSSERRPIVNQNRRVEIKFLDFQMNYTAITSQAINQPILIAVKFIAGTVPLLAANEDIAVVPSVSIPNASTIFHGNSSDTIHPNTTIVAQNTAGFQEIYNGSYQTEGTGNKATVNRVVSVELCGQFNEFDRGYLEVSIKAASINGTSSSAANQFPDGYYKCVVNLAYAPAARESEGYWSDINQCNGVISATAYSYRLWFRTRQYIVDGGTCLRSKPVLDEHN